MNDSTVYLGDEANPNMLAQLKELAAATDRKVVQGEPPADAQLYDSYNELLAEMHTELDEAATTAVNALDRRPNENRAQHRARMQEHKRSGRGAKRQAAYIRKRWRQGAP